MLEISSGEINMNSLLITPTYFIKPSLTNNNQLSIVPWSPFVLIHLQNSKTT